MQDMEINAEAQSCRAGHPQSLSILDFVFFALQIMTEKMSPPPYFLFLSHLDHKIEMTPFALLSHSTVTGI